MFRESFQSRKPISPTWFVNKAKELAEIAQALKLLRNKPEVKENCQQLEIEVIQRQNPSNLPEYKSVEQHKKEIAEEQQRR